MMFLKSALAPAAILSALAGCQAIYPTQYVPFSPLSVVYKNDSYDFRVVDLTLTSAREANDLWAYTPRQTPLGLRSDAGQSANVVVRATTFGEADDSYLIAQVSQNVDTFSSAEDFGNPPPSPARPYEVGVGDVFTVTIEGVGGTGAPSTFQTNTTVDYAGNIFLTDVGEVNVGGQTVGEARQTIADRFRDARLSANGSATVTGFNSQRVLVASPGRATTFLPITNIPITLRSAYLQNSSGIDTDAARQVVVLRRDGQSYSIRGLNILRRTYGYDVFLRNGDEIQIFDEQLAEFSSASVSPEVLALRGSEFQRENLDFQREEAERAQRRFEAGEIRADQQDRRAADAAEIARQNAEIARQNANRAEQQLQIARLNAQLAQNADSRAALDAARAEREDARREAADARAREAESRALAAEARAERDQARLDARDARERAAVDRANRQLALSELDNSRSDRAAALAEQNAARDFARSRFDLGLEAQDRFFVAGEVGQQQTINLPFGRQFTLAEAIFGSNGIQPITGDPSRIYVVRVKSTVAGSVESYIFHFDGGNLANTPAMTTFQMRPDDYVLVMPRAITNWSRFISQLVPTLNSVVSAARLGV
jgi:protein involved in polysaccharide export with SLBB domain